MYIPAPPVLAGDPCPWWHASNVFVIPLSDSTEFERKWVRKKERDVSTSETTDGEKQSTTGWTMYMQGFTVMCNCHAHSACNALSSESGYLQRDFFGAVIRGVYFHFELLYTHTIHSRSHNTRIQVNGIPDKLLNTSRDGRVLFLSNTMMVVRNDSKLVLVLVLYYFFNGSLLLIAYCF